MNLPKTPLKNLLPPLLLLLLPLLVNLPALAGWYVTDPLAFFGGTGVSGKHHAGYPWIDPNVGFQAQALGRLSAEQWLSGRVPWWNPYNGAGLPLAAEAQPAALFLPFILLMHFQSGGLWLEVLLQMLAGIATYALLRRIGLSRTAALGGALLFEFNGTFAWHGAPISTPIAFLPLLLLGIEQLRARVAADRAGGWLLVPAALAWSIYAGFPETAYIDGLFAGLWTLSRLAGLERRQQVRFAGRLCLAVGVGLLCSLPQIVPFAEFVALSHVGGHEGFFAHVPLPAPSLAQTLMPWLYGPIFAYDGPAGAVAASWRNVGGYFSVPGLFVALLGLAYGRRGLCLPLLGWIVLCLAKTYDVRPVSDLVNLLPMIKSVAFFRYAPPSWEFAGAVLAAMALDGMQRRPQPAHLDVLAALAATALCAAVALRLAGDPVRALLEAPHHAFTTGSLAWAACTAVVAAALALSHGRLRRAPHLLAVLLALDACLLFVPPIRSGLREPVQHGHGTAFLQAHARLQRVYSLGPLAPNYGAFFGVAQINHNYLPVTRDWVDYIHARLDPQADMVTYTGTANLSGKDYVAELAGTRRGAYEELGVKYVLAQAGTHPFAEAMLATTARSQPTRALPLEPDRPVVVAWTPAASSSLSFDAVTVLIGNYRGESDGVLRARVCVALADCAEGERALAGSVDNAPLAIRLDRPLRIDASGPHPPVVEATITQAGSRHPVALWLMDADEGRRARMDGNRATLVPKLGLLPAPGQQDTLPRAVYEGDDMAIYELPAPRPYFEAEGGDCSLQPSGRTRVSLHCEEPARLLRREAFYPGWTATVDGRPVPLERAHGLFQGLAVPAGTHAVAFDYRPTHALPMLGGFGIGLFALAAGGVREWRRKPTQRNGDARSSSITMASSRPSRAG